MLVSLLVGVGFDAYVVIGRAPKEITVKNEGKMEYKNSNNVFDLVFRPLICCRSWKIWKTVQTKRAMQRR